MILPDHEIQRLIGDGVVSMTAPGGDVLKPTGASLDIRLGRHFQSFENVIFDPANPDSEARQPEPEYHEGNYVVKPGTLVLGSTLEWLKIPDSITVFIEGKSSLIRCGLDIGYGWVDPGFNGTLTMEISVRAANAVVLRPGMRIAQLVFARLESPAGISYYGKYQGQEEPTQMRLEDQEPKTRTPGVKDPGEGLKNLSSQYQRLKDTKLEHIDEKAVGMPREEAMALIDEAHKVRAAKSQDSGPGIRSTLGDDEAKSREHQSGYYPHTATVSQYLKDIVRANWEGLKMEDPQAEAMDMIVHKIARIVSGDSTFQDHWLDIAGYAMLAHDNLDTIYGTMKEEA